MARLRLDEIARHTGGRILQGPPSLAFDRYGIDSRLSVPGELFFALRGKRDGHDFVADAAARGAGGAVVSRPVLAPRSEFGLVQVADTTAALQALAAEALSRFPVKVVAVTGSVGKTTTKEFAAALLASRFRVLKSEGNFNNHLGLALSLLRLRPDDEIAVLEMGMSAPGEIMALTRIAPPDVAVITNVSPVHLQFFSSLDDIARAKREILDGAKPGAAAVLNGDDPRVMALAAGFAGRRVTFGRGPSFDVRAEDVRPEGLAGFRVRLGYGRERTEILLPFLNEAAVADLLAAAAVSFALGLGLDDVAPAATSLRPSAGRGLLIEAPGGLRVYDDSYNSSPRALEAVLQSLGRLPAARKIAVLGDMLELGPRGEDFHRQAGETVARTGWDILVAVGRLAAEMARAAVAAGMREEAVLHFDNAEAASAALPALLRPGDLVLVKGSHAMRMERIVARLRSEGRE